MRSTFDAIVIGAGPAGSSTAILLARAGWTVALVEKQIYPRRKVCGECMAASNLPLLDLLGVGAAFATAAGPPLEYVALMRAGSTVTAPLPRSPIAGHPWGRALGREMLDTLLVTRARAMGVHVMQPWAVRRIEGRAGAWRCEVRSASANAEVSLNAPVLVAAHGSWERPPPLCTPRATAISTAPEAGSTDTQASAWPRDHLGVDAIRRGSDLLAFKAGFRGASLAAGVLPVLAFSGGYGGMVLADDGVTTLACCIRRDVLDALRNRHPGRRAGEVVEAMLRSQVAGVRAALHGADREGAWLATGALTPGVRVHLDDGMFRVGNAAGEAHPIIGEGMSMAMQSAWLLSGHLVGARSVGAAWQRRAQRAYADDWRQHFIPRLRLARLFAHAAMRPTLSGALLGMAMVRPGLLTQGARWGGKVRSIFETAPAARRPYAAVAPDPRRPALALSEPANVKEVP